MVATTAWTIACKEHPVAVRREVRHKLDHAGIDSGSQVHRLPPGVVEAGALGDPNVCRAESPWPIGRNVKAQPIWGDRREPVIKRRVNLRPEVDGLGPFRKSFLADTPGPIVSMLLSEHGVDPGKTC